jgi:hypothetical protein
MNPPRLTSALLLGAVSLAGLGLAACGDSEASAVDAVVRDPDDQQVLTPAEVVELREGAQAEAAGEGSSTGDTIPLEEVDPTTRLFTAFSEFNGCMEDGGQPFRGDPRSDPSLLEDGEYMEVIQRCAARSDILGALEALQEFNANLTPEQVEERNEQFLQFEECLEGRGWTVEAAPDAKGLLTPSQFESPDGGLDERDMRQCGSEVETE